MYSFLVNYYSTPSRLITDAGDAITLYRLPISCLELAFSSSPTVHPPFGTGAVSKVHVPMAAHGHMMTASRALTSVIGHWLLTVLHAFRELHWGKQALDRAIDRHVLKLKKIGKPDSEPMFRAVHHAVTAGSLSHLATFATDPSIVADWRRDKYQSDPDRYNRASHTFDLGADQLQLLERHAILLIWLAEELDEVVEASRSAPMTDALNEILDALGVCAFLNALHTRI